MWSLDGQPSRMAVRLEKTGKSRREKPAWRLSDFHFAEHAIWFELDDVGVLLICTANSFVISMCDRWNRASFFFSTR